MSDLSGQTVLITGALTGIGRATALAFAQEGSRVVVSGRRDDAGQALVTELRALGAEAEFVRADVRREDDVRNLVDKTVARFGRLDVAVNNAGTEGKPGPRCDPARRGIGLDRDSKRSKRAIDSLITSVRGAIQVRAQHVRL